MKNKNFPYARIVSAVGVAGMLMTLLAAPVRADEMADVTKLLRAGKVLEALNKTNEFLAKHPADPQLRFMKGVLLTEQNKSDEAVAVFTKLTEDYPSLPEPYNNLAVLYAAAGQYDKARVTLEKAIRTNPSYMTAYENLGDVYGKMASQAYDKALALGTTSTATKSKLTLLRTFSSSTGSKVTVPEVVAAQAAPVPTQAAANTPVQLISPVKPDAGKSSGPYRIPALSVTPPAPVVVAKAEPVKPPAAAAPLPPKPDLPKPAPAPVAVLKQETAKPAPVAVAAKAAPAPAPVAVIVAKADVPKPVAPPATPAKVNADSADRDAVLAQVHGWAQAWAAQNVDGYLAYYSSEFEPPKGLSRQAWADERRARIAGKGHIRVEVESLQVVVNGNTAKASFRQVYQSDRLSANTRKTLVLVKNSGKWQIKQESSGS